MMNVLRTTVAQRWAIRPPRQPMDGTESAARGRREEKLPAKVRLEGVSMKFVGRQGGVDALADVDLSIDQGEFVCIVGPSGCGKSTLLNMIAGLVAPTSGGAYKDGAPITRAGPDRAVIFQEPALFPWLTAVQNVEFALKHVRSRRERREQAMAHLRKVHLGRFAHLHPHELSGGMRQRVAIARALALDPDVLLMDEPFAALDAQTRDMLIEEVQRLWLETRKTVVFVTHNVREAVALGDRVVCMGTRPGRIKLELPVQMARPRAVGSPDAALIAQRIHASLQDEIAKTAQEESDIADSGAGDGEGSDPSGLRGPAAGLMGDGI